MTVSRRAHRTVAFLATLVMLASLGLVAWHRATVVHGRCAEHGEEIHLVKVAGDSEAIADPSQTALTAAEWILGDGDDHCELLAADAAATAPTSHAHVLLIIATPGVPAIAAVPVAPPSTLYRLAPKTSPPV
ncbi:MAG: hypothetical protein K8W52_28225 [Deltaproteobacteria bacterium]|nr:hypothetical protein [Deltaproteobacteria bacterium]